MSNTFKVRCLDARNNTETYTKGKIYEVINGKLTNDNGKTYHETFPNFRAFKAWSSAKWELVEDKETFTKSDLKTGMWAKLANGEKYLVVRDCETAYEGRQEFCLIREDNFVTADDYDDNLTAKNPFYSIVTIFTSFASGTMSGHCINCQTLNFNKNEIVIWNRNSEASKQDREIEEMLLELEKAREQVEMISDKIQQLSKRKLKGDFNGYQ